MPYIKDWSPSAAVQILVYGQAKLGKTWGAMTFPRPVVMDFDGGVSTARNPAFVAQYGMRDIFYETFEDTNRTKGVVTSHNAFDDACRFFDEWMKKSGKWKGIEVGAERFDTWVIDSGTTLSEVAQNKAVILTGAMKLSRTHADALQHGVVIPRIQDYGSERSLVEQFIDMVKASGKNLILLCHEKEVSSDAGYITGIVPLLTGRSSEVVPLKFDEVYNLRIKKEGNEIKRYIQTQPDGLRKVGSRYGIPDGTTWEWNTIESELTRIKNTQTTTKE